MHWLRKAPRGCAAGIAALLVMVGRVGGACADCSADGTVEVAVTLSPPSEQNLAGVTIVLDYPEDTVALPGFQNQPSVQARVAGVPEGFLNAPNDTDKELIISIAGMGVLPAATIFKVDFDHCQGRAAIRATDFHCEVDKASNPKGELVDGSSCGVEITFNQALNARASEHKQSKKKKEGDAK